VTGTKELAHDRRQDRDSAIRNRSTRSGRGLRGTDVALGQRRPRRACRTHGDRCPRDANQALIDATRQPAFVAVGQFDGYFKDHPEQADDLRAIQQPLAAFKDRCGLQVSPTDALTVLADV
jgi:hemophore-related protein